MISRCSEARDRTSNRNEWSSETATDHMPAGYRRMLATSIVAIRSKFSVATGPRSIDDGQLVLERDDFQVQRGARLDEKSERVEQRNDDERHDCRLSENAWNLNRRNTYEVLGSH